MDSEEYLKFLQSAAAEDLPAPVLVRAYRQLPPGKAADATMARLMGNDRKFGYLRTLWAAAPRKIKRADAYTPDDFYSTQSARLSSRSVGRAAKGLRKTGVAICTSGWMMRTGR